MGFDFSGFVLVAPRSATSNATTTEEATNGVDRDWKPLDGAYAIPAPPLVSLSADQYRAAVLLHPEEGTTEYAFWAANTADIRSLPSFEVRNQGSVTFPEGTLTVTSTTNPFGDPGSNRAIIVDDALRSILTITSLEVQRGDTGGLFELVGHGSFNPVSGVFTVTDPALLVNLGGGLSTARGDQARQVVYTLAGPSFWWSRNDAYEQRFKWDGRSQRWRPLRGTPPRNLGMLLPNGTYGLSPAPSSVPLGEYLPGDSTTPDSYCAVRLGSQPDAISQPVAEPSVPGGFGGIKVVEDENVDEFDFAAEPTNAAVVGQQTGTLRWNPAFVDEFAGQNVFYSYVGFIDQDAIEPLGLLENADVDPLFLAPIPGPTEYPFIRIGSRQPLEAFLVETEQQLAALVIGTGQVGVALSTGRLRFAEADVLRSQPESVTFDEAYLGASVYYDGVSLTQRPVPLRQPVQVVDSGGVPTIVDGKDHQIFIPNAQPSPSLGVSGVLYVEDRTGTLPNVTATPGVRPGGGSGLVRSLEGPWDLVLFTDNGQIRTIETFEREGPRFRFKIPRGTAFVDLRQGAGGSEVILGREDLRRFQGRALYFVQSSVQPAAYVGQARLHSRVRNTFTLTGTEVLVFRVGGSINTWDASTNPGGIPTAAGGTFTAAEIATSLTATMAEGAAVAVNGRVVLQTDQVADGRHYGEIEIGFGPSGQRNLSGAAALGFLPGWLVRVAAPTDVLPPPDLVWLPDNGTSLGVYRSPFDLDGSQEDVSDVNHVARFDDVVLQASVSASPIVLLDRAPLEDIAGYDENVFFRTQRGLSSTFLLNYENVYYQFGEDKFAWANTNVENVTLVQAANNVFLGRGQVIPPSMRLPDRGLFVSLAGSPLEPQTLGDDYLLPQEGNPGVAVLVQTVGSRVAVGGRGSFTAAGVTFTDPTVDFEALGVKVGYHLQIEQGDAQGTYVVASDAVGSTLVVEQPFPASGGPVPWTLYEVPSRNEVDVGVVADAQYVPFNHLPTDPFEVRVLSPLGAVPANSAEQEADRLVAVLGDALAHGRSIAIRFGSEIGNADAAMTALAQQNLGVLVDLAQAVPDPDDLRFVNGNFAIRVGSKTYTFETGDLVKVVAFTNPLVGNLVEVQEETGILHYGSVVLEEFDGQDVIYVETFLDPIGLSAGVVEYRASDGLLNFSAPDMTAHAGVDVFLVETMVAMGGLDVTLNPVQGSLLFTKPLREFQIVEVHYFQAENGTGEKRFVPVDPEDPSQGVVPVEVTEQLPLFVRLETATPDGQGEVARWLFNPTKRLVRQDIEPAFYVGSTLYNVGSAPSVGFDLVQSVALLQLPVASASNVRITYAVLQAFGGEQTYTVSQPPVYRPPFRIEANRSSFTLEGDRTEEFEVGKLLRVAQFPFYVTGSSYDSALDRTEVSFLPETELEAGTRDPGANALSLLSDVPLATSLSSAAAGGFWVEVTAPYEPINRGFQSIIFQGNLVSLAVPGHVLELGGLPFIVAGSSQSDDGTRTQVDVTSVFPRGFAYGEDAAKLSVRPLYQPQPTLFLGRGGLVSDEPYELVLFGERNTTGILLPGRTLRPTLDYQVNLDDGSVEFLSPPQGPLQPTQSLYLRHTQQRVAAPVLSDGVVLYPRFVASYTFVEAPSEENGKLGTILRGTYTFASPDTFFYRTVPLLTYLGEVADEVALDVAAQLPGFGSATVLPVSSNATQGRLGLNAQLSTLEDTDRAARVFLDLYNRVVLAFEQVLESISGNVIGDRDGKFKFFVGRHKEVAPPGYEDEITGRLVPRNLFSEVFFGYNPSVIFLERDPLVDPTDFTEVDDELEGAYIDPDFLGDLQQLQRDLAANEVDDIVLVSRTRKQLRLFPLRLEAFGRYERLATPSVFSRLFPERASAFTLTDPGIGANLEVAPIEPGVYAFRKRISRLGIKGSGGQHKIELPKRASTFLQPIGEIGNPVLGQLTNIGDVAARPRLPRARVFRYSPFGFPEVDDLLIGVPTFTALPRPAVMATPLPLGEFPLGEDGLPDFQQLAALGGETIDLTTGDPDLFTPPFEETDADVSFRPKVTFGRPDGRIIDVQTSDSVSFTFPPAPGPPEPQTFSISKSVFVGEVLLGCIVTFATEDHTPGDTASLIISENDLLEVATDPAAGGSPIQLERGDTFFVTPTDAEIKAVADIDEPSTNSELAAQLEGLPGYRIGFDLGVDRPEGEYRDITFPSFDDPSIIGLKEILGQRPPTPLSYLEADVRFRNGRTEPAPLPALFGGITNDSGDYSLPYLTAGKTELEQLGAVAGAFNNLFGDTGVPSAAYPDEILGVDGQVLGVLGAAGPPAALLTSLDATPVASAGAYVPRTGVGDVRSYDVLLVQTGQGSAGLPAGSQGILSVGGVAGGTGSEIEPPRFVTPTAVPAAAGDRLRYRLRTAMSFVNRGTLAFPPGMRVRRVGTVTEFDITAISNAILVFNDGSGAVSGGLNNVFSPPFFGAVQDNVVTINLWTAPDLTNTAPVFLQSVVIAFNNGAPTVTGDAGVQAIVAISADNERIYVDTVAPFVTIAPNPGLVPPTLPEDPLVPGDTIPLWFTIDLDLTSAVGAGGASTTGFIANDRLTLDEALDLRTALPRDEPVVAGVPVFTELEVAFVASQTTDACTVNAPAEVNGGAAFTFLARSSSFPRVGTFDPVPGGTGRGTLRVMGFEGHGNTPIVTSAPFVFSAIPSADQAENEVTNIAVGTGIAGTGVDRDYRISSDGITALTTTSGSFAGIEAGDVCVITGSSDATPRASTKVGTYLVKHVVVPNVVATDARELILDTVTLPYNTGQGWASVSFPTLVAPEVASAGMVTVSATLLADGVTSAWAGTGTLYFITQPDPEALDYPTVNFLINYISVDNGTNTFVVDVPTAQSFDGSVVGADAVAAIDAMGGATLVAGFFRFDVAMDAVRFRRQTFAPFPPALESLPRNTVGYDSGTTTAGGFRTVLISGKGGASTVFTFGGAPAIVLGAPALDELGITVATPISNLAFVNDPDAYVYDNVPQYVEVNLAAATWNTIHAPGAVNIFALLPGDFLSTRDGVFTPGFFAQAGVFFEPSWPRSTLNLAGADERIVDAGNSVPATTIGYRDGLLFGEGPTEGVTWQVRRIRRFHDVLQNVGDLLGPLRYVYETRRGVVADYGSAVVGPSGTLYPFVVTSNGGTQLGGFDDDSVDVNPGDLFRLLDDEGQFLEEVEIGGIEGPEQVWLKAPGITVVSAASVAGMAFEIYLRQVPVPHEQSNEQLLDLVMERVVLDRQANLITQQGGVVPVGVLPTDPRVLQDTDVSMNFVNLGIEAGDIVVIDPAGNVAGPFGAVPATGQERGARAFGDRSVPGRTTATIGQPVPFVAGGPSELDDNRGWYRVTEVASDALTVSSTTGYSADPGDGFVTFGEDAEYAVLPTVSASTAPFAEPPGFGIEGQMDLRPTAFAGTMGSPVNSFKGNLFSIAPFSYRVFRPNTLFSSELIDLVLFMRERTLSMIEELRVFFEETKDGSYFVFQRDQYCADLGNPLIPDEGLGVMSNSLIDGVRGVVGVSPFANASDALSVLDRRFWCLDARLDNEYPAGSVIGTPSYSTLETNANNPAAEEGDGRPVLPDLIADVLDNSDQLREQRYAWLDFRVNRETGTLVEIQRFVEQLPKKKRDELRQLRLAASVRNASG